MPPAASLEPQDPSYGYLIGGKYRVQGLLGRGGTGHVFEAIQEPIGRRVAVKVLRPDLPPDEQWQFEARFLREASRAGALQHPNVVTVHDYGRTDDGMCYIVMELLRGRSLKDVLKDGPLSVRRALDIFEQMLKGLRAAHQAGLVHRDIKPGNIVLCAGDDGRDFVKILDFGLVKDRDGDIASARPEDDPSESLSPDDNSDSVVTRHGAFLGTPHYIAPEQARGGTVDGRSDLYSAGVVLYRMVCGALPYYDRSPTALALKHVHEPYPPMATRAPGVAVPHEVEALVQRCMEKRPDDRLASADVVLGELALLRRSLFPETAFGPESVVSGDTLSVEATATAPSPTGRSRGALGAAALLLLGLIAGGAYTLKVAEDGSRDAQVTVASATPAVPAPVAAAPEAPLVAPVEVVAATSPAESSAPPAPTPRTTKPRSSQARPSETRGSEVSSTSKVTDVPSVPAQTASAPSPAGAQRLDGVSFTADEASAALRWLNDAPEAEVRGAGITARQVKILLEGRPWSSLAAFAATYDIGPKTVEAVRVAARDY